MSLLCQLLFYAANSSKQTPIVSDPPSETSNSCPHPPVVIDPTSETSSIHVEEQGNHKIVTCTCTCTCTCRIYNVMYCDNFYTANTETPSVSMDISDLINLLFLHSHLQFYLSEHHCEDLDVETAVGESHHESIDPLTLEMEVQDSVAYLRVGLAGHRPYQIYVRPYYGPTN